MALFKHLYHDFAFWKSAVFQERLFCLYLGAYELLMADAFDANFFRRTAGGKYVAHVTPSIFMDLKESDCFIQAECSSVLWFGTL